MTIARTLGIAALVLAVPGTLVAQSAPDARPRYPTPPRPLPEAEEIALAMSAAPSEVSDRADIWVLRGTEFVKARAGSNGCSCMVSRDLHEGSLYPICFDQEGTRSLLLHELMASSLRAKGMSEADVDRELAAARASGRLPSPSKTALAYMMSPKQVLFSSPQATGVRVGAWHPHIMIGKSGLTGEQLGLLPRSTLLYLQVDSSADSPLHEFVVLLPVWSDGSPAPAPRRTR